MDSISPPATTPNAFICLALGAAPAPDDRPIDDNGLPAEIDFSKGVRGLHHIPSGATILTPDSERQGITPDALTDELKPDTENR